ncbi:MAG: murein biosynthesis integral membrane protein MurJ [Planctomycetota bacterium]|nr:murein biosynthesis integral membrane protein MurJ [Planctomycetota bacterium]
MISSTLLSRVLGAVRDTATAGLFGLGPVMDAFAFAFRIPNLARRLFGEGALSATFLPAFSKEYEHSAATGHRGAWQLTSAVLTLLALGLTGLVIVGELILALMAHFAYDGGKAELLLGLTAVMLPYAVLICLAAQVSAVLQALGRFGWPSFVPVVLNICWLTGVWAAHRWAHEQPTAQAYTMAAAILLAGVFQLALQIPELYRLGFRYEREWRPVWGDVMGIIRAILPVTIALSITQINSVLDSLVAWVFSRPPNGSLTMALPGSPEYPLQAGAVSALYFGERIYQFPLGVFGVALGTVLFPLLARHAARGELKRLRDDLSLALRLVLVIGIPASLGLMAVAHPLTRALLQHGEFGESDANRTSAMISAYSLGVWAYCGIPVLFRGFYAVGDRTAPLRIGMFAVLLDTVLNLTLIWFLAEQGLACSTAISAMAQFGLLCVLLQRRVGRFDWPRFWVTACKALVASLVMLAVCLLVQQNQPDWGEMLTVVIPRGHRWLRVGGDLVALGVPVAIAGLVYLLMAWILSLNDLWLLFQRDKSEGDLPPIDPS